MNNINSSAYAPSGSTYTSSSSNGYGYYNDAINTMRTIVDIENILKLQVEDLPLHINDNYTELAKKILNLRLKANI